MDDPTQDRAIPSGRASRPSDQAPTGLGDTATIPIADKAKDWPDQTYAAALRDTADMGLASDAINQVLRDCADVIDHWSKLAQERGRKYTELLMGVSMKHLGESRHETALRYIQQAERGSSEAAIGMETRTATTEGRGPKDDSPAPEGIAQTTGQPLPKVDHTA